MAQEANKDQLLTTAHKYLKSLAYEFESYDNIKLFLDLRGVPKNLEIEQELKILNLSLENQRTSVEIFKHVIDRVN